MVAGLRGGVGTGTEGVESSAGRFWGAGLQHVTARCGLARVWATGLQRVTARCGLARVLKLMKRLFI
jgi:hypothetical protein